MISITITNLDKLQSLSDRFPAVAQKSVDNFIKRSLYEVAKNTEPLIPVASGLIKRDLQVAHLSPFQGSLYSNRNYAAKVHDLYSAGTPYHYRNIETWKIKPKNLNAVAGFLQVGADKSERFVNDQAQKATDDIIKELSW